MKKTRQKMEFFDIFQVIIWGVITIGGIFITYSYINKVEDIQERYKLLANLGIMLATLGAAFFIYYISKNK